VTLIARWL